MKKPVISIVSNSGLQYAIEFDRSLFYIWFWFAIFLKRDNLSETEQIDRKPNYKLSNHTLIFIR